MFRLPLLFARNGCSFHSKEMLWRLCALMVLVLVALLPMADVTAAGLTGEMSSYQGQIVSVAGAKPMPPEPLPDQMTGARSKKICQMTGDVDFQTEQPTRSRTGISMVPGTDLGSPFEHDGRLYFLFGDTNGEADGIAFTNDSDPESCPLLTFVPPPSGKTHHTRFRAIEAPGVSMKADEVPTTGFSAHSAFYVFVRTGYALKDKVHVDERGNVTNVGKAALLRSDDHGMTFRSVSEEWQQGLGEKLVYLSAARVDKADLPDLPTDAGEGLLVFGSGKTYRESNPYLAFIDLDELKNGRKLVKYFAGVDARTGKPLWLQEANAQPLFDEGSGRMHGCVGELSVTWNPSLRQWLMLYNCENKIVGRVAQKPWGPWSEPAIIFDPVTDGGFCKFIRDCKCDLEMHCAPRIDPTSPKPKGKGDVYAPYVIPRYTLAGRVSTTIYYMMSTWNPYQVVLMKTTLARSSDARP